MTLFCIIARDAEHSATKRAIHLEEHLKYLRKLNQEKRLFAAGPLFTGESVDNAACGSLLIVDFNTLEEAKNWFLNDIYYQVGIFKEFEVKPYIDGLPYC